ncbi:MAG: LCP family protein [Nostocoides sp.]
MLEQFEDVSEAATRRERRETSKPRRRWGRRILIILAALLALVLVAGGGYLGFLNHVAESNTKVADLLPEDGSLGAAPEDPNAAPLVQGRGQNILLIGSDAREGETFSRSDVIIVAHVSDDNKKVYLMHFPRDLYVEIPGHGKNKINASYAFGGAPLLVQTLQNLTGVKIDHVAKTDFVGFQKITDAVGGVRVWAEEASSGKGNGGTVVIHQGWNDLNGEQALQFVRERYELSQGDISRGRRQQAFLKAVMLRVLTAQTLSNPVTVAKLVDAGTANLVIDQKWSVADMRSQAWDLRSIRSGDITFITAPYTGFDSVPGVGSVDLVDASAMKTLGKMLGQDSLDQYTDVSQIP